MEHTAQVAHERQRTARSLPTPILILCIIFVVMASILFPREMGFAHFGGDGGDGGSNGNPGGNGGGNIENTGIGNGNSGNVNCIVNGNGNTIVIGDGGTTAIISSNSDDARTVSSYEATVEYSPDGKVSRKTFKLEKYSTNEQ